MSCDPDLELAIDELASHHPGSLAGKRIGLITNHTGVDRSLRSGIDRLAESSHFEVAALFGPEHGVRGDAQAGVHVEDGRDPRTGIPVYSLYGPNKRPSSRMLEGLDVLVCHLQDGGSRYWTYLYTLAYAFEAASAAGLGFVVLDRPNPVGGVAREGNLIDPSFESFVGGYGLPMRHGLTMGEFARYLQGEYGVAGDLTVVPMQGWRRDEYFEDTGLSWVPASPNTPTVDTLVVYPGTCLVEGSNLSEGRGTTRPFEVIGAPWIDAEDLAETLNALELPGVIFRPTHFTPTFSKHSGQPCHGVQLHVTCRREFAPVRSGLHLLAAVRSAYPDHFAWLPSRAGGPRFIDLLAGSGELAENLVPEAVDELVAGWQGDLHQFSRRVEPYLLYD